MNLKKIYAISIILIALSLSLGAISAGSPIELGKIVSAPVEIDSVTPGSSVPSIVGGASSTPMNDIEFSSNIQIDISKMKDSDKDLLKKAIEDENKTVTLNTTSDHSISITLYQGVDLSIDGDNLNIEASSSFNTPGQPSSVKITSVEVTGNGQTFVAKE